MPVRKFRSVEEMNQPTWHRAGDPALFKAIASAWSFARRANPRQFPRGVIRYRGIDEMWRAQDDLEGRHVRALEARRRGMK